MFPDSDGGNGFDHSLGVGFAEFAGEVFVTAEHHGRADDGGDDEADDLVAGTSRSEQGDGHEGAADQEAADVAGEDYAVVGIAEIIDSDHDREGEDQSDQPNGGASEVFSDDGAPGRDREGAEKFDRAGALFIGP